MYHTYPYKARIPILIDGKYETRIFTSKKDISRYIYSEQFGISPYKGSYGEQPSKWVEKSFLIKSIIERKKTKAMNYGK